METAYVARTSLKNWAEDDRPRDKLLLKGRQTLSDAELLAILIGSGTRNFSALDLAKEVFKKADDNLAELSKLNIKDLTDVKGIGEARAVAILAAMELGRRRDASEFHEREKITRSADAYKIFRSVIGDKPYEEFWIILLNRSNKVIKKCNISEGGISGTIVDPKKVFKISIDHRASSIILGHNHPSGALKPSDPDKQLTKRLKEGGSLLEISVLDHLIIGENGFFSFADEGLL